MSINIPRVETEPDSTKNGRMVIVIGLIIMGILLSFGLVIKSNSHSDIYVPPRCDRVVVMPAMIADRITAPQNTPVIAKYIRVYNLTRRELLLNKIIAVTTVDRSMIPVPIDQAAISFPGDGVSIVFELPNEVSITQIILDVAKSSGTLPSTQVEIIDGSRKVVWMNTDPLEPADRYVYLYMVTPGVVIPVKSHQPADNIGKESEANQEDIVLRQLARDSWDPAL